MKQIICFTALVFLLYAQASHAQEHPGCSTPAPQNAVFFPGTDAEKLSANPYVVQIFVHILRNDDGTNPAMSDAALKINLDRMASFYRPHNICFTFLGRDFIDNTTWNINYTGSLISALHAVNPHSNAIDIYVHKTGFDNSGGNSYAIPSDKCSVAANASFNFEHEMGHCLGLYHTFEPAFGIECPDGSNCSSAGDLICDTPADFSGSQNSSNGCLYNGTQTINCNGNTYSYNPPTTNIMSYWAGCYSNFTADQGTRMRNTIDGNAFLQARLSPVDKVIAGVTLTGEITEGAQHTIRIGNIGGAGDVAMNGNAHGIFNAGSSIQATPGTQISPSGNNSILLTINNLCNGLFFAGEFPNEDRSPARMQHMAGLEVAPNPFSNKLTLRVQLGQPAIASLQLFDFSGRMVENIPCRELAETGSLETDLTATDLQPGVYVLRLQWAAGIRTLKLIKI